MRKDKAMAAWMFLCCALVFATLVQGGVTRLTHSGLSIVEWKPVTGVVPPLSAAAWDESFMKYKATPEYLNVNYGMNLEDFKSIFWMEWAHRLLARSTALAILVPLAFLAFRGRIEARLKSRFAWIAGLIALQGVLGWYMVYSGLIHDPHVSHYRLTAHLLTACALYACMFWTALDLAVPVESASPGGPRRLASALIGLIFLTLCSGGLVAGLRAGLLYNTFPLMAGRWIPPGLIGDGPLALNFLENRVAVQFDHRLLGLATASAVFILWLKVLTAGVPGRTKRAAHLLLATAAVQVALGILTLLNMVPTFLAASHQGNALLLLGASLFLRHELS